MQKTEHPEPRVQERTLVKRGWMMAIRTFDLCLLLLIWKRLPNDWSSGHVREEERGFKKIEEALREDGSLCWLRGSMLVAQHSNSLLRTP